MGTILSKVLKKDNVTTGKVGSTSGAYVSADFGNVPVPNDFAGETSFNPNKPASKTPTYNPNATTTTSTLPTYKAPEKTEGTKAPVDTYVSPTKRTGNTLPTYVPTKHNTVKHQDTYVSPKERDNVEGMSTYVVTKHNTVEHEDNYIPLAERNKMNKLPTYHAPGTKGKSGAVVSKPNQVGGGFGNDSDDDFNAFMNSYDS